MFFALLFIATVPVKANFTLSDAKLPQGMYQHFAAIHDDTFTVFAGRADGGLTYITTSSSTSIDDTLNNNTQWTSNPMTFPLKIDGMYTFDDSGITINERRYIVNPYTVGGTATYGWEMFIYDLRTNGYTVEDVPTYPSLVACSVYDSNNNIIYNIGEQTQRYNVSSDTWITPGAIMVIPRTSAGCSFDPSNDNIFVFGGFNDDNGDVQSIEKYKNNAWTLTSATLSAARRFIQCRFLSLDGNIYCIGGFPVGNIVDIFNPSNELVEGVLYLRIGRYQHSVTLWNDDKCIIVAGGANGPSALDSIETFGDCTGSYICNICSIKTKYNVTVSLTM